jgi:hypothetical protein
MVQKLNSFVCQTERSARPLDGNFRSFFLKTALCFFFLFSAAVSYSQEENAGAPQVNDYKSDTSFHNFSKLRYLVAKAQINKLKNGGALLVRLKTNATLIARLKEAGNMDMATKVEREVAIMNKIIVASYLREFTFCPVYFFYSNRSDSVKHKKLDGILVDSNLVENPALVCNADFYLIAESGELYNSSLGIVPESEAAKSVERGSPSRDVPIIIKNRYFIQLHKPFPYFQIKKTTDPPMGQSKQGNSINLEALYQQARKIMNTGEAKQLINLKGTVRALNTNFEEFYKENKSYVMPAELVPYVY